MIMIPIKSALNASSILDASKADVSKNARPYEL